MDVGARIKQYREAKGYTVNKLANMAGISQSYLRDVELGEKKNPTVYFLSLICDALGVSLKEFFEEEDLGTFTNSELSKVIYKLTPAQRDYLLVLLKSFMEDEKQ